MDGEHRPGSGPAGGTARLRYGEAAARASSSPGSGRLGRSRRFRWAYAVLLKDDDLLAVAKPSGLPTLPGGGYLEHTLLALVRRHNPEVSPIHRLGRGTSGVVLFGRTAAAGRALCGALREHRMSKVYRALVQGAPLEDDVHGGRAHRPHRPSTPGHRPWSQPARPGFHQPRPGPGAQGPDSLVEVHIETGRPHQIRIHLAACGHPLVGDPLYAAGGGVLSALPGDEGYLLHALRLDLPPSPHGRPDRRGMPAARTPPAAYRPQESIPGRPRIPGTDRLVSTVLPWSSPSSTSKCSICRGSWRDLSPPSCWRTWARRSSRWSRPRGIPTRGWGPPFEDGDQRRERLFPLRQPGQAQRRPGSDGHRAAGPSARPVEAGRCARRELPAGVRRAAGPHLGAAPCQASRS